MITDERFLDHDTGYRHPERPDRLRAALAGVTTVDAELLSDSRTPRPAERSELELVHRPEMVDRVATLAEHGGGHLDADTPMGAASLDAALYAVAGALSGLDLRPEPASSSGPGMEVLRAAARLAACDDEW